MVDFPSLSFSESRVSEKKTYKSLDAVASLNTIIVTTFRATKKATLPREGKH